MPLLRTLNCPDLDTYLEKRAQQITNKDLQRLFVNCFANTFDTATYFKESEGKPFTFIITGDIEAMWLRDSSAQVWPYLALAAESNQIRQVIAGLINQQSMLISKDPYANAFYHEDKIATHSTDLNELKPGIHERKWELDSLCYHIDLSYQYWKLTKDVTPFDNLWCKTISTILETFKIQQRKTGHGPYLFDRTTSNPIDTLSYYGGGPAYRYTGMVASSFRPSDDECVFPFNIPGNFFVLKVLSQLYEMLSAFQNSNFEDQIVSLKEEIENGISKFGVSSHPTYGRIYAYEVDGLGNQLTMDDANIPSLLSLPLVRFQDGKDEYYLNTRAFILSTSNPFYFKGACANGIGSPHTGPDQIWPLSLITQALTSTNDAEILECIKILIRSSHNTGLLHESFDKDDCSVYSRPWFAWCNSMFGFLIDQTLTSAPELIAKV